MNKLTKSIIILAGAIALTGCGQIHPTGYQKLPQVKQEVKDKSKSAYEAAKEKVKEFKDKHSNTETSSNSTGSDYDESKFPDMYEVLGKAEIDESKFSTTYSYSHDDLDRTTTAYGLVNYKAVMDSKGWRADFEPNSEPSGWYKGKESNNKKVSVKLPTGKIYNGYFYNRSHLIADSLGGRSYKYNVVTGTRQQNVGNNGNGGMQYIEKKVVDYVEKQKITFIIALSHIMKVMN